MGNIQDSPPRTVGQRCLQGRVKKVIVVAMTMQLNPHLLFLPATHLQCMSKSVGLHDMVTAAILSLLIFPLQVKIKCTFTILYTKPLIQYLVYWKSPTGKIMPYIPTFTRWNGLRCHYNHRMSVLGIKAFLSWLSISFLAIFFLWKEKSREAMKIQDDYNSKMMLKPFSEKFHQQTKKLHNKNLIWKYSIGVSIFLIINLASIDALELNPQNGERENGNCCKQTSPNVIDS